MSVTTIPRHGQVMEALELANTTRIEMAAVCRDIAAATKRDGRNMAGELLASGDPRIEPMPIHRLLDAIPRVGYVKVAKTLQRAGVVAGSRRVRDLTDRQRTALVDMLLSKGTLA
jgi:hypothetical protein